MWSILPPDLHRYLWIDGRSSRREWWRIEIIALFSYWFVGTGALMVATIHGEPPLLSAPMRFLLGALMFWINVASTVRRLHDRNKSGWWALAYLFPVFGIIWHFIECGLLPPRNEGNRYGPPAPAAKPPMAIFAPGLYKLLKPTAVSAETERLMKELTQQATAAGADQRSQVNRTPANRADARSTRAQSATAPARASAVNRTRSPNAAILAIAAALAIVLFASALLTRPSQQNGDAQETPVISK